MKILILTNSDLGLYKLRKELLECMLKEGNEVYVSVPCGEFVPHIKKLGCTVIETEIFRRGKNPFQDLKLLSGYKTMLKFFRPDMVFSYSIKPNLYGGMACAIKKVPYVANITGLGSAAGGSGSLQMFTLALYKIALRKAQTVFVQNEENRKFFVEHNIAADRLKLLPGSGVNLEQFRVLDYPEDNDLKFVFISRIMKEKGIDQYLEMASYIREKNPRTHFHICGFFEEAYQDRLKDLEEKGIIVYHGFLEDVREILACTHCTVHPSYYPEGISNVLLESAASGRPIITTDHCGCREVVEDGVNGYMIPQQNGEALIEAVEKFINLTNEERRRMGLEGRKKVEPDFSRQIIVEAYLSELSACQDQGYKLEAGEVS